MTRIQLRRRLRGHWRGWRNGSERLEDRALLAAIPLEPEAFEGSHSTELSAYANSETHDVWQDGMVELSLALPVGSGALIRVDGILPGPFLGWNLLQENGEPVPDWTDVVIWEEPTGEFNRVGWGALSSGTTRIQIWWDTEAVRADPNPYYTIYASAQVGVNIVEDVAENAPIVPQFGTADTSDRQLARYLIEPNEPLSNTVPLDAAWVVEQFNARDQLLTQTVLADGSLPIIVQSVFAEENTDGSVAQGLLLSYDSATGELSVRAADGMAIAALELRSPQRWFQVPRPPAWQSSPFDVARADKLFRLDFGGFTQFDFGPVLPSGLTREAIEAELRMDGAYLAGGRLVPYVISIDGDIPWEQAFAEHFVPLSRLGQSTLTGTFEFPPELFDTIQSTTNGIWRNSGLNNRAYLYVSSSQYGLELDYRWQRRATENTTPPPFATAAYWELSFDGGDNWPVSLFLPPCSTRCTATLPLYFSPESTLVRIRSTSPTADFTLEQFALRTPITTNSRSFSLTVAADEVVRMTNQSFPGYSSMMELRDEDGQLVAMSTSFALRGPQAGSATYTARLTGAAFAAVATAVTLEHLPAADYDDFVDPLRVRVNDNTVTLNFWMLIDRRTCGLEDFSWNGPELTEIVVNNRGIELSYAEPLAEGMYTLHVAEGRCLNTLQSPIAPTAIEIDAIPPQLVEFALEERRWLPPGETGFLLRFNESFESWNYELGNTLKIWRQSDSAPLAVDLSESIHMNSSSLYLPLGNLAPGEYRLELQNLSIFDRTGNQLTLPRYDFTFVVAEQPPDGKNSPFDLDLNGIIDELDLGHLTLGSRLWRDQQVARFDLNDDGDIDQADTDYWLRHAWDHPPGDVDFDGDFDDADLALLAHLQDYTPADWRSGDFNGDGYYTTDDLILAMQFGFSTDVGSALEDPQKLLE